MQRIVADWLWLLVFCSFVLGFFVGGWSASKETPTQQQHQRTENAKAGSDEKPAPISQSHPKEQAPKAEEKEQHPVRDWVANFFELKLTDAIIAIFTVVLAVKTSGLFVETAGLRSAADKQSRDMAASLTTAEKSAAAAEKSAAIAESALIDLERPYVVPIRPVFECYPFASPGSIPVPPYSYISWIKYGFHNMGRTPGFIKEITDQLVFAPELPEEPLFAERDRRQLTGHFPIKSDGTYSCPDYRLAEMITEQIYQDVTRSRTIKVFYFGYIKYADVFGYLHTHAFCFMFSNVGKPGEALCTIVGGNAYNYDRKEKIPSDGLQAMAPMGAELPYPTNPTPEI